MPVFLVLRIIIIISYHKNVQGGVPNSINACFEIFAESLRWQHTQPKVEFYFAVSTQIIQTKTHNWWFLLINWPQPIWPMCSVVILRISGWLNTWTAGEWMWISQVMSDSHSTDVRWQSVITHATSSLHATMLSLHTTPLSLQSTTISLQHYHYKQQHYATTLPLQITSLSLHTTTLL